MAAFAPARRLYAAAGFRECAPFADYILDPNSVFMTKELRTRKDVYAYDLLAWGLHKEGRDREADQAMTLALREGTQDAQLFYHAGMIAHSLGRSDDARAQLTRALTLNPFFHPTAPAIARVTLAGLPSTRRVASTTSSVSAP